MPGSSEKRTHCHPTDKNWAGLIKRAHILTYGGCLAGFAKNLSRLQRRCIKTVSAKFGSPALKIGSANQRHHFSSAASLLSRNFK